MERALAEFLAEAPVFLRRLSGEILHWTTGAEHLFGFSAEEAVGRSAHALLKTGFPVSLQDSNEQLIREGTWHSLLSHRCQDGRRMWTESQWRLKKVGDSRELWTVVETSTDVTRRELLARELHHRIKNTVAIVQGLAQLSLGTTCKETEEFRSFQQRLQALSKSHDILIAHEWSHGEITDVVESTVDCFGGRHHFELSGTKVPLKPSSVFAYTLALHELATNSLKHGALSKPEGKVKISWSIPAPSDDRIYLVWRESGGPSVPTTQSPGFGTALITKLIAAELGDAAVKITYADEGLICEINGPIQKEPDLPGVELRDYT